jgi:LuxR family maltose regulon positive regulatory protein
MQPSIHISKIIPPQIPQILPRPRLIKCLEAQQDKKLILILGQAAQGKSTLAVSYVNSSPVPSAWINLSPDDTDAVNLFYLLGQALQRVLPEVDFSPALTYPAVALGPREEAPLYRDWLLTLLERLARPVQIILDGLDRLPPGATSFRLFQVLLAILPPQVRLFILSREMPPVDIQELAEQKEVFRLTNADLAFTLGETTKYFHTIRKFHLSPELVQRIHRLTEGWIGGLVLFCDSLDWVPESQRERYVSQELAGKFIWGIFQYFGERILSSLPREVREFLIKSSILDVVEPDFVREAMGLANPQAVLEELVKRNLFVQSIYDKKKGWSFRYHPLFKEFLQSKFQSLMAQDQQVDSYYQAASLSERREDLETAVRYYLKARAFPETAAVLVKVGMALIMAGRTGDLARWLAALPEELIQDNPWLLVYRYATVRFTGPPEILADLQQAKAMFQEQGEVRGSLLAMAYLLEATSLRTHKDLGPIRPLLEQGEALAQSEGAQPYTFERVLLLSHLGFASYLRGGAPLKGAWACRQAYLLARDLGNVFLQALALMHEYFAYALLGDFSRLENIAKQVDKLFEKFYFPELFPYYFINLSQCLLFQGDFLKAAELLKQAREAIEQHGLNYLYPPILMCELWSKAYMPDAQDIEESARSIANISLTMGNVFVHGLGLLILGESRYQRDNFRGAQEVLRQAREILGSEEGWAEMQWRWTQVLLALAASHLQENGATERELEEALEHFTQISSHLFSREAHLAMALWKWRQGQAEAVAHHLEAGLELGKRHGYQFSFMLNKQDMLQVCLLALELQIEGTWDYVSSILKTRLADLAEPELSRLSQHANRKIADKALEIRRTIWRSGLPKLLLQTLGSFRLWRGEALVDEAKWEGHQPQLLLKAIITHGSKGVSKDVLIEDLWPEASQDLTEKNFKVNLHRLRKFLEPTMNKTFGSSYVHLKANLISLDPELCQVDADEFLSLYKNGEKKEEQGEFKAAMALYRQAIELYGGEFLAEELYQPWVEGKREEFRGRFLDLLYRLARLLEVHGSVLKAIECYKKVIQTEPLAEPAYRSLMLLYAQRGMRNTALLAYQDCRRSLKEFLNVEPEEATTAIYRKILESTGRVREVKPRS